VFVGLATVVREYLDVLRGGIWSAVSLQLSAKSRSTLPLKLRA